MQLLQVGIPGPHPADTPVIVRCGNCSRQAFCICRSSKTILLTSQLSQNQWKSLGWVDSRFKDQSIFHMWYFWHADLAYLHSSYNLPFQYLNGTDKSDSPAALQASGSTAYNSRSPTEEWSSQETVAGRACSHQFFQHKISFLIGLLQRGLTDQPWLPSWGKYQSVANVDKIVWDMLSMWVCSELWKQRTKMGPINRIVGGTTTMIDTLRWIISFSYSLPVSVGIMIILASDGLKDVWEILLSGHLFRPMAVLLQDLDISVLVTLQWAANCITCYGVMGQQSREKLRGPTTTWMVLL